MKTNSKTIHSSAMTLLLLSIVTISYQNCGKFNSVQAGQKRGFLAANKIFSRTSAVRDCSKLAAVQPDEADLDCADPSIVNVGINGSPAGGGTGTQIGGSPGGGGTGTQIGGSPGGGGTGTQIGGSPGGDGTGTQIGGGGDRGPASIPVGGTPLVDRQGNPILDRNGNPILIGANGTPIGSSGSGTPLVDKQGNPVLDGNGNPILIGANGSPIGTGGSGSPNGGDGSGSGSPNGSGGSGTPVGSNGSGQPNGSNGNGTPSGSGGSGTPNGGSVNSSRDDFPGPYLCSTRFSALVGYSVKSVNEELKAVFMDENFNKVCEFVDPSIKANLIQNKTLSLIDVKGKCPNLAPGRYRFGVVKASQTTHLHRNLVSGLGGVMGIPTGFPGEQMSPELIAALDNEIQQYGIYASVERKGDGNLKVNLENGQIGSPMVIYDINVAHGGDPAKCDNSISPLIVQLRKGTGLARKLELTAQFQGVMFDILGANSYPKPYDKKRISWLTKTSVSDHYFITLPDRNGNVTGINQMFGDNTSGPDKKFAKNGYEALAKYDGRRANGSYDRNAKDGFINAADEVFSSLRLWKDANQNGVAEKSELFSAADLGVEQIDLNYEKGFSEMDRFGNRIAMKSVVKTNDGNLHVMYDLWFRLME